MNRQDQSVRPSNVYGVGTVRLAGGGVEEEIDVEGIGAVSVRYERCAGGWQAAFTVTHPTTPDLGIVHRLTAGSLAEARRTVPSAALYLAGQALR